jgi:lipopolysaccharide export system permease protein
VILARRHDGYVLRAFLGALGVALLFLTSMVVVYDLADRIDRLPGALDRIHQRGLSATGVLLEYYATLIPFLWLKILPLASLIAASLCVAWLTRQNELAPLVAAGVPSHRVLAPILAAAVALTAAQVLARETFVPALSRRHDDLHRLLSERPGRADRFQDVPHVQDTGGGRLSMSGFVPGSRRMEGAWITFVSDPAAGGGRTAYRYSRIEWDAAASHWVAPQGGTRWTLRRDSAETPVVPLAAADPVPLQMPPSLIELTLRESAALGLSSTEIAELAEAYPTRTRFRLLYHQQLAAPAATLVLLLLGLPFVYHVGRRRSFRPFVATLGLVSLYFVAGAVCSDLGARGALNPVVGAWAAAVVFGALGIVLFLDLET